MFDWYAGYLIWQYQKLHQFSHFKLYEIQNSYEKYYQAVVDFRQHYNLLDFSFRQIDNFLWGYGKEFYALSRAASSADKSAPKTL